MERVIALMRAISSRVCFKFPSNRIVPTDSVMMKQNYKSISGKVPLVLLWLLGVPIPILIIIFLIRGCS